jgi:hypothetical protein
VEDDVVSAGDVDVGQMQERSHSFLGYRTRLGGRQRLGGVETIFRELFFGR